MMPPNIFCWAPIDNDASQHIFLSSCKQTKTGWAWLIFIINIHNQRELRWGDWWWCFWASGARRSTRWTIIAVAANLGSRERRPRRWGIWCRSSGLNGGSWWWSPGRAKGGSDMILRATLRILTMAASSDCFSPGELSWVQILWVLPIISCLL